MRDTERWDFGGFSTFYKGDGVGEEGSTTKRTGLGRQNGRMFCKQIPKGLDILLVGYWICHQGFLHCIIDGVMILCSEGRIRAQMVL